MLLKVREDGVKLVCELEKDTAKYESVFPALSDIIDEIKGSDKIQVIQLLNKYQAAPYGLGEVALELFLAFVVKYFGDELAFKKNPYELGEVSLQSFEQIEDIVNRKYSEAVFEKRSLDQYQVALMIELYKGFSNEALPAGYTPRLAEVAGKLNDWFAGLPPLARSEDFYQDQNIKSFLQLLKSSQHMDNYRFLFSELQAVCGFEKDTMLTKEVKNKIITCTKGYKKEIESKLDEVKNKVFEGFCDIFAASTKTSSDLISAIDAWYKSLDSNQTDLTASWHHNTSKQLVLHLKNTQNIEATIYEKIPGTPDYGLGKIESWNVDNVTTYLEKIRDGKKIIEENKILVDLPVVEVKNGEKNTSPYGDDVQVKFDDKNDVELTIELPGNAKEIWISYNNENPISANTQKEVIKHKKKYKPVRPNETLKLVSIDGSGHFSKLMTVQLVEKSVGMVRERTFGLDIDKPKNSKETKGLLRNLIDKFLTDKAITRQEMVTTLKEILRDFENEN